jgi:uncharacterized RDD family membrane protein YckC
MFCTKCGSPVVGSFCRNCGARAPEAQAPALPAEVQAPPAIPAVPYSAPALSLDYAQWSTRVFGYLIDTLVVGAIVGALLVVPAVLLGGLGSLASLDSFGSRGPFESVGGIGCCLMFSIFPLASLAVGLYNKVYLVAQRGASIGQGMMHIRVVNAQGGLITTSTALVRLLAHVGLSFIPFGGIIDLLWPLWDERRQTLHDKAVNCYVVNVR